MKETILEGEKLGAHLERGDVVVLSGELGSGKTTFTKGVAKGLGVREWEKVTSPTFVIMNKYEGRVPLYHVDFYRLHDVSELGDIGFFEYLNGDNVTIVEWGEKFKEVFPKSTKWVNFKYINENTREITITER